MKNWTFAVRKTVYPSVILLISPSQKRSYLRDVCDNSTEVILTAEYAKRYCPNFQLPEIDADGTIKHCLPGHEKLCGSGYSCFFSGTNYQCCPTEEETNLDVLECPSPSITILTDAGLPLTCITGLHDCPQNSMQCVNVGKHSICCDGLSSIIEEPQLISPDEAVQLITFRKELSNVPNLECPEPAFTILDGNGDPVSCNEEDCTHQVGRFCYKVLNKPICCEGEERTIDDDTLIKKILQDKHRKKGDAAWSALKYRPLTTAQHQLQQYQLLQNDNRLGFSASNVARSTILDRSDFEAKQTNLEIKAPTEDGLTKNTGERQIDNRYKNSQQSNIPSHANTPSVITTFSTITTNIITTIVTPAIIKSTASESKVFGKSNIFLEKKIQHQKLSPLSEESQENGNEIFRYRPHKAGGYAVSQAFPSKIRRAPNDLRALAREYLFEHIRRGWPYSDEFYRTYAPFESHQQNEILFDERT